MADKLRVALVFGGRSSEHSISCVTAGGVLGAIDRSRYDVIPVGVTREGAFVLVEDDASTLTLGESLPEVVDNGTRVLWPESAASRELRVVDADGSARSLGDVDAAFPILHGRFGEDGTIQGMFELVDLPYVGNGVLASSVGMDKHFTKTVLAAAGIAVAPWVTVTRSGRADDAWRSAAREFDLPVFVKPARAGSSVGVTRVASWDRLDAALDVALAEDDKALIEPAIAGREVECAVLSGRGDAAPRVSVAGEIVVTGREFYDFEAKYLDPEAAQIVCPADLTGAQLAEMQGLAARAFDAIGASGLARIDFFLTADGFVVNEINTMPGFTPISMFPKCWIASGLSYTELISELIALGLEAAR
ncbi:MAG: D-alanine--D-alanine ligase [Cryobacterium sp.]|nr:D-alanine--D-alanine ligase [Cryobacterium sp.]